MPFPDAKQAAEEILSTQHQDWRPDFVEITPDYISLVWTRRPGGRAYFKNISGILLKSWTTRLGRWHIVVLQGDLALHDSTILRTPDRETAERLVDAISSLVALSKTPRDR